MKVNNVPNLKLPLILLSLMLSCNVASNNNADSTDIGKTVVEWNVATIRSLEAEIEKYGAEQDLYRNRLDAFREAETITDVKTPDTKSLRFKFLQLMNQEGADLRNAYIIEYTKSGELIQHLIYVVSSEFNTGVKVDFYRYNPPEWQREMTRGNVKIDFPLDSSEPVELGEGFNKGELIVTRFAGSKVTESDYFIFATMPDRNITEKILID